jgi:hypothetical protein
MFSVVGARLRAEDGTSLFYFSNKHESRSTLHVAMLCNYYLHIVKASIVLVSWRMSPFSIGSASKVSLNKLQNKFLNVLLQNKGTEIRSVGYVVLTAVVINVARFWNIAPCNLQVKRRIRGTYNLRINDFQP